jgi:hypothetical protein
LNHTKTMSTITIIPRDLVSTDTIACHGILATQHAEMAVSEEKDDVRTFASTVSIKPDKTIVIKSRLVEPAILVDIDLAWGHLLNREEDIVSDIRKVYFVRVVDTDNVKVGFSQNIEKRLSCLQVGCPWKLILEHSVVTENYRRDEKAVHDYLRSLNRHVQGEWFCLPMGCDMVAICQHCGIK